MLGASGLCVLTLSASHVFQAEREIVKQTPLNCNCDGLNRYGLDKLMCLKVRPIGNNTIMRHGLVGEDMSLLEEVCHHGGGF